jgi:putative restriction endonuclease
MSTTPGRIFGHIPDSNAGSWYQSREELARSGIHKPTQAGISYSSREGADSIVASGGYEDDEDYGDVLIYTGMGGNDPETKRQVADQQLDRGNLALAVNCAHGLPVRVVRGANFIESAFAPQSGYRYDGLYAVESYWRERGKAGFHVWRFRLVKCDDAAPLSPTSNKPIPAEPVRRLTTIQRIVRSTAVVQTVKELHHYLCQVCRAPLETPTGRYAEGAHIRPLGKPHNGPDVISNVLCLCPNHHVLFDLGALTLSDELDVLPAGGKLWTEEGHSIAVEHVRYHRSLHTTNGEET